MIKYRHVWTPTHDGCSLRIDSTNIRNDIKCMIHGIRFYRRSYDSHFGMLREVVKEKHELVLRILQR